jgi:hypothetical protein
VLVRRGAEGRAELVRVRERHAGEVVALLRPRRVVRGGRARERGRRRIEGLLRVVGHRAHVQGGEAARRDAGAERDGARGAGASGIADGDAAAGAERGEQEDERGTEPEDKLFHGGALFQELRQPIAQARFSGDACARARAGLTFRSRSPRRSRRPRP